MSLTEFFLEYYDMFFELAALLIMVELSVHLKKQMKSLTRIVVGLLALETVCVALERWSQTFDTLSMLRPMMTATIYSLYPLTLIFVMQLIANRSYNRKMLLITMIPVYVCIPIFFTSQWTHLVFWFWDYNAYAGGPIWFLPYALFGFYAVMALVQNLVFFRETSLLNRFASAILVLVPVGGVLIYWLSGSGKDYSPLFTSAVVVYFIFLYIHRAKVDQLTGLLNRQSYYQMIDRSSSITGVVSIDMNNLKELNDKHGHEAGDKALITVAKIMQTNCSKNGNVFRVGGDEFMVLYTNAAEREITDDIDRMRKGLKDTPYMCAFGYAMLEKGETVMDAIRRSDAQMYVDKALTKQENKQ